jgi:hypothetical protein
MISDIGDCFKRDPIIKETFEEPMICLNCNKKYISLHIINESLLKLARKCPICKSNNVLSIKDSEYFEKELRPYLESRLKDEYQGQI